MLHHWVKYLFLALNSTFEIHASGNDIIYCVTFYFLTTLPGPPSLWPPVTPPPLSPQGKSIKESSFLGTHGVGPVFENTTLTCKY